LKRNTPAKTLLLSSGLQTSRRSRRAEGRRGKGQGRERGGEMGKKKKRRQV